MRPLTATDILDFYASRADLLVLRTSTGEYDHIDASDIDEGRPDSYNLVTLTDETDAQILLARDTITDGEWFPDALDDEGDLDPGAANDMAFIITSDGVLQRCLKRANFASTAWTEAAEKANHYAALRAAAVAEVVDVVGGNQSEAARLLALDQSTVNRLVKKARAAAEADNDRPKESTMTFTSSDLRDQVTTATDASDGEYDVDAIVEAIIERHGAVPVDDLDSDEFWGIVMEHAK
jgi:DNA-binding transcriptional regulator YdaS (Cro superfamily)